jgi:hypothetical protein
VQITTIGLDIAKNVFQVYGIDAAKEVVVRKQLRRGQVMNFFEALPPCLIGMEACATAHSIDCNSAASCSGVPTMQYNRPPTRNTLKILNGLTPFESVCKAWTKEPNRFKYDPVQLTSGLHT